MPRFMIDHHVWIVAAHTLGGLGAGLFVWRCGAVDARLTRAAAVHFFLGIWFAVLGSGHLVAVIVKGFSRTLSPHSEPFPLLVLGLAIALPGLLMSLSAAGIAAGQSDTCRTAAAADLWLATLLGLTVPPLTPALVVALSLLLHAPVGWPPAVVAEAVRWIGERRDEIYRRRFSR